MLGLDHRRVIVTPMGGSCYDDWATDVLQALVRLMSQNIFTLMFSFVLHVLAAVLLSLFSWLHRGTEDKTADI